MFHFVSSMTIGLPGADRSPCRWHRLNMPGPVIEGEPKVAQVAPAIHMEALVNSADQPSAKWHKVSLLPFSNHLCPFLPTFLRTPAWSSVPRPRWEVVAMFGG